MAFSLLSSAEALSFLFFLVRVFEFSFLSKSAACSFLYDFRQCYLYFCFIITFDARTLFFFIIFSLYLASKRASLSLTEMNFGEMMLFKLIAISPQISPLSLLCLGCLNGSRTGTSLQRVKSCSSDHFMK